MGAYTAPDEMAMMRPRPRARIAGRPLLVRRLVAGPGLQRRRAPRQVGLEVRRGGAGQGADDAHRYAVGGAHDKHLLLRINQELRRAFPWHSHPDQAR